MKFSHLAPVACVAVLCILIGGCGDVFRPVATPLPLPSPDPQTFRLAVFTSCFMGGGTSCVATPTFGGSATPTSASTDVNVSGDTLAGVTLVGRSPLFALVEASLVVTADRDTDTVTAYTHFNLGTSATIGAPSTVGLPAGAKPTSLADASGTIYVAESGRNVVGVLGGAPLALTTEIPVGSNPVNLAVLPNGKKVYAVNQASDSITVIATADNSVLATVPLASGASPVWAVPSADSTRVYVVNQNGTVTAIDATSDALATCAGCTNPVPVGSSPNHAVFDARNQRVLVTNSGSGSVSVISADPTSTSYLSVKNIPVGTSPVSITVLADGTRAYVANSASNSVTVINSLSLAVTKTISLVASGVTVGSFVQNDLKPTPVWIASDAQSSKVFTANRDAGDVSVILTSNDSELADSSGKLIRLPAPQVDPACVSTASAPCAKLNPIFVGVGPG